MREKGYLCWTSWGDDTKGCTLGFTPQRKDVWRGGEDDRRGTLRKQETLCFEVVYEPLCLELNPSVPGIARAKGPNCSSQSMRHTSKSLEKAVVPNCGGR